jgi:tRNA A-37 threonylcarbamoyl transferase component Bud32
VGEKHGDVDEDTVDLALRSSDAQTSGPSAGAGEGTPSEGASSGPSPAGLSATAVALGTIVGNRYRLIEPLGEGGMGQVFVAENMAIGLRVAIKVLKPQLMSDPVFKTRFNREARAVAAIQHTNVVRFLDLVLGDPTFLVMELVRGETLRDHLKRDTRFPLARAVAIAERLARALSAVHDAGIVHRDLKPANIILTPDAEIELAPKIIDFGVVRFAAASEGLNVTRTGQVVGTLHYMAPEQISTGEVDPHADLYALGSVLYHMLAGRPPFGDSSDEAHLMHNILFSAPPPATAGPGELLPELSALLSALLAKKPEDRPRDATTVAVELGRIRRQLETSTTRAVQRPPLVARVATPVLLACCLGALGLVALRRSAPPAVVTAASRSMLSIASTPRDARVEVDGRLLDETTPTAVRGLAAGKHVVRISLGNRTPAEQTVVLGDGERQAIDAVIPPASHFVEIKTKPADASVFVDARLIVQRTPVRVQLFDDEFYQLRIEKAGYEPVETRITPEQKEPVQLYKLEPEHEPRGSLIVDSNATARVFVDGGDTGFSTPSSAILLPVGAHTVQIRTSSGGESSVQHVSLTAGDLVHVALDPIAERKRR